MSDIQRPPFLLTYWNPFNEKAPGLGQSFLNYVKDVSLANYTANATGEIVGSYIERASREQSDTANMVGSYIKNASDEQISVLREGFAFLDQRMGGIQQELINNNILLEDIAELLKLPDSEKKRQLHIERGLKFSTQALRDEDIALDAKNELDEALKLMPQDWFVLQQLGMLLLYNAKVLDVSQSKEYFLKAAKYGNADSETEGITFINSLFNQNFSFPFQNKDNTPEGLKVFVREAYLSAALAAYILTDFEEAANISKKALTIIPEDPKSLFFAAKYLARNNNKEEAFIYLKKAITNAPYLCIATSVDEDLKTIPNSLEFCDKFSADFFKGIKLINIRIDQLKEFINNSYVFQLKSELDKKDDLHKGCEFLELPLIDPKADYRGKDALYYEVVRNVLERSNSESYFSRSDDFEDMKDSDGKYIFLRDAYSDRGDKIYNQLINDDFIRSSDDYTFRFVYNKEYLKFVMNIHPQKNKLRDYRVKDLGQKWSEIKDNCEQVKKIEKEIEREKEREKERKLQELQELQRIKDIEERKKLEEAEKLKQQKQLAILISWIVALLVMYWAWKELNHP